MPGSAILDPNKLIDSLIPIIDDIRSNVADPLGCRHFNVSLVTVLPTPRRAGDPSTKTVTEVALTPKPLIKPYEFNNKLEGCGVDEWGLLKVEQISLTYTEDELTGRTKPAGAEFYWKLTEGHGQGVVTRYYTIDRDPFPVRDCCPGWTVVLRRAKDPV
jgi:hypothetical protein